MMFLASARMASGADGMLLQSCDLAEVKGALHGMVHCVTEVGFRVKVGAGDPFLDVEVDGVFSEPGGGELRVPAFWVGGDRFKVRYAPRVPGRHVFRLVVSAGEAAIEGPTEGAIEAVTYAGENRLLKHGPVHLAEEGKYFAHADGTPFFWLADSWWHGMTSRLTREGLETLVADRVAKGFSVIQFAVAFPCDIAPFDDRGGNEAGHAWERDFKTINPAYWDLTDERVMYLIGQGMMPSVLGSWGYYVHFMGAEKVRRHWRYVIARYGAFPVAWILCGESRLPWYPLIGKGDDGYQQTLKWTEISKYVGPLNAAGFGRLLGIHPGPPLWFHNATYEALADYSAVDMFYGMGGHGNCEEYKQVLDCIKAMEQWRAANPGKPAIIGELAWEGMYGGSCNALVQRIQFWGSVLRGAPGHCYGTDSLWQMNCRGKPFGESVQGYTWGNAPWEEAYQWPGSTHVGIGKRILEKFEWWRFGPHPEWFSETEDAKSGTLVAAAAGISGEVRVIYIAKKSKGQRLCALEPGKTYFATHISPIDGREYPVEAPILGGQDGKAEVPRAPINQDWVLVVRAKR